VWRQPLPDRRDSMSPYARRRHRRGGGARRGGGGKTSAVLVADSPSREAGGAGAGGGGDSAEGGRFERLVGGRPRGVPRGVLRVGLSVAHRGGIVHLLTLLVGFLCCAFHAHNGLAWHAPRLFVAVGAFFINVDVIKVYHSTIARRS